MSDSFRSSLVSAALAMAALALPSRADVITLDFNSLPSAQGWTYHASGSQASSTEASVFTANGTSLNLNTVGDYVGSAGGSVYYSMSGVVTTQPLVWDVRARMLQSQGNTATALSHTLTLVLQAGSQYYFMSINNNNFHDGDLRLGAWAPGFDPTQYHDYRWMVTPGGSGAYQFLVDGAVMMTGNASNFSGGLAAGTLAFGDGTGGSNINADISYFRFTQGEPAPDFPTAGAVPEPGTWALMGLGMAALAFARRRKE